MFNRASSQIAKLLSNIFAKKPPREASVNQNAAWVSILLFLSRSLGLIREVIISRFVDIRIYDLYVIADKIPSIIRRLSGEGVLDYAYIPPLSEFDKEKESAQSSKWISGMCGMFVTAVLIVVYLAVMTSDFWAAKLLSSYSNPDTVKIFTDFFAMQVPLVAFYFLSSMFIVILLRYEVFNHSHFGQPIANIFKIATLVIGYSLTDSYFIVGLSALAGAVSHIIWQYYGTRKLSRPKRTFFPDKLADLLAIGIGLVFLVGASYYIANRADATLLSSNFIKVLYTLLAFFSLFMCITVFFMRKRAGDGTLEYGSTGLESTGTPVGEINFHSYLYIICLAIIRKISIFTPYLKWIDIMSGLLIFSFCISGIFMKNRSYIFRRTGKFKLLFPLTIILAILGLFNLNYRNIFVLYCMSSNLIQMYRDNFLSEKLSVKIKKINQSFLKNFSNSMFGVGINQIISLVSIAVAAKIGHGAPSYISRTDRLMQVPINLIAVPFGLALLPRLSKLIAENNKDEAQQTYNQTIIINILLSVAAIFISMLLTKPLSSIFLGGKTRPEDILTISRLFKLELFGLSAWVLSKVLASVYFATNKSNILFRAAIVQCLVNVPMKLAILKFNLGITAFPIASVIGAWANALFLLCQSNESIDLLQPIKLLFKPKKVQKKDE